MEFMYHATDVRTGKHIRDVAKAASVEALVKRLRTDDLLPLKIKKLELADIRLSIRSVLSRGRVNGKELAVFTRQLGVTLAAGLMLTEALDTIADDLPNHYFREILKRVTVDIRSGTDLSTALAKYAKVFPTTYTSIVKSGEATGKLHKTMVSLADYLERSERTKEKVKGAIRYPIFVMSFALIVLMVLILFLIPKFAAAFDQVGMEFPLLTRIVIGISNVSIQYFPFFIAGMMGLWLVGIMLLRTSKGRYAFDAFKIRMPIVGKVIIHKFLMSRFCRTLGILLSGDVGLAKSLDITSEVLNNRVMTKAIGQIKENVVAGSSISEQIRQHNVFPSLTYKMTAVGEKTGKLSEMLGRTADYYDEELDNSLQTLSTMLEPILIVFVGAVILVIVLAIYLPIFNMAQTIR